HDDKIAGVEEGRVDGLRLAREMARHERREAAEHLAVGVDDDPASGLVGDLRKRRAGAQGNSGLRSGRLRGASPRLEDSGVGFTMRTREASKEPGPRWHTINGLLANHPPAGLCKIRPPTLPCQAMS